VWRHWQAASVIELSVTNESLAVTDAVSLTRSLSQALRLTVVNFKFNKFNAAAFNKA
jgi:hypothetical protein